MSLPSAKLREIVFQFLFCHDFIRSEEKEVIKALMQVHKVSKRWATEAAARVLRIESYLPQIDEKITLASKDYVFDRICRAERNLLRLGVFELLIDDDIPPKVAISEAIRLARKYSTPESANFVNAILDFLYQRIAEKKAL